MQLETTATAKNCTSDFYVATNVQETNACGFRHNMGHKNQVLQQLQIAVSERETQIGFTKHSVIKYTEISKP